MKKLTFVSLAVALLVSVIALAQDTTKPGDAKPDSIKAAAQEKQEQKPANPENFLIGQTRSRTCSNRSRKALWISWCRWENSADTSSRRGPTWSSGSNMILAILLPARWGSSGVNGRRRTPDWSGLRTVAVRVT